jgi:tetratricopeptide (TPR) repeat protein
MRAGPSVCLSPGRAAALVVAGLVWVFVPGSGPSAWAAEDAIEAQPDIELPAEVSPDAAETPPDDSIKPKVLDRSFMRPDLKGGSEDVPPPQSTEESKQDKLGPPNADVPLPSPVDRPKALGELYELLSKAKDAETAATIERSIENLWLTTGSATVDLLMNRTVRFTKESDLDLALQIIDATVDLAPDEAEAWYLRAKVHYRLGQYALAIADLKRAIERDPKHYRALEDLGLVLDTLGTKKEALEAYRKALEINPFLLDAHQAVEFLSREVGRDI